MYSQQVGSILVIYQDKLDQSINQEDRINKMLSFAEKQYDYNFNITEQIGTEEKISDIQARITEENKGFEARLRAEYPTLTKTERGIMCITSFKFINQRNYDCKKFICRCSEI